MKIAVVNDVIVLAEALRRMMQINGHQIAWVAHNGAEAVQRCKQDVPDLILMDLMMPVMNGVEATRQIMAESPCSILIVTATVDGNAAMIFEAMSVGALDVADTPFLRVEDGMQTHQPLLQKIALIGRLIGTERQRQHCSPIKSVTTQDLVVIGASTGGPAVLADILSRLPRNFPAALVIVQHVDKSFAPSLTAWLNEHSALPVRLASAGDLPMPGEVLMANTNDHMAMDAQLRLCYVVEPAQLSYRPSVDVFFSSVAAHWPSRVAAVLLTGMGRDGASGLLRLREQGAYTIAQDEESCAVYGMPKAAVELRAAVDVLPSTLIADAVIAYVSAPSKRTSIRL